MADLVNNGLGCAPFDLTQHIIDDRGNGLHVDGAGGVTAGAFSKLAFEKQTPYQHKAGYTEYPKCVSFGSFNGIANDARHEAELKAKHAPAASAPSGSQAQRPPVAPAAPGQAQRH